MADLSTIAGIEEELLATVDYFANNDVALAKRRLAAMMQRALFPMRSDRDAQMMEFDAQMMREEIANLKAFISALADPTEAQRLANPSVLHTEFTMRGGYCE